MASTRLSCLEWKLGRVLSEEPSSWSDGVHNITGSRDVDHVRAGNSANCRQNVSLQYLSLPVAKCLPLS
jgi:hypothetical protein